MKLKTVEEILPNTRVILRMDLDVPMENGIIVDNSRLAKSIPTIKLLLDKKCQIAIIGHMGRPNGVEEKYSLRPTYVELMSLLEPNGENTIESVFLNDPGDKVKMNLALRENQILFLENLRFWPEEEAGESGKLRLLLADFEVYVNDAIAVAHRKSASIMLHKIMQSFYGLAFVEETEKILSILKNPKKPIVIILGGAKKDKLDHLNKLSEMADKVLIGGKLPTLIENLEIKSQKVLIAKLRQDKLDLNNNDIDEFKKIIETASTIVWAGAMGYFEKDDCKTGTLEIAKAVANSSAYKIIAGGDTGASIKNLGLLNRIDLIASGGGMVLEFLSRGSLPAWE